MRESRGMFSHDKGMSPVEAELAHQRNELRKREHWHASNQRWKLFLSQLPKPYHEAKVLREYAFTDWEIGQLPETTP